jgi:low affinity Fe/Cu permease
MGPIRAEARYDGGKGAKEEQHERPRTLVCTFCPRGVPSHRASDHVLHRGRYHRVWGISGPLFGCSDTWQLVINTGTTIATFLMVFVIQNTQNRDTAAMPIKIDELIRVTEKARNMLLDLEELDDKTLEALRTDYEELARKAKSRTRTPPRAEAVPKRPTGAKARKS